MKSITYDEFKNSAQSDWTNKKAVVLKEITNLAGDVIVPGEIIQILNKSNTRYKEGHEFKDGYFDVRCDDRIVCGVKHDLLSLDLSPFIVFYRFNRKDMPEVVTVKTIIERFIGSEQEAQMLEYGLPFERPILGVLIKFGAFGKISEEIWSELSAEYKKQRKNLQKQRNFEKMSSTTHFKSYD